jgi:hypothetical protein
VTDRTSSITYDYPFIIIHHNHSFQEGALTVGEKASFGRDSILVRYSAFRFIRASSAFAAFFGEETGLLIRPERRRSSNKIRMTGQKVKNSKIQTAGIFLYLTNLRE